MAVSFIIAEEWKKPSVCQLTDKILYIHVIRCYLTVKDYEVLIHAAIWMNLENMLSRKSQTQRP